MKVQKNFLWKSFNETGTATFSSFFTSESMFDKILFEVSDSFSLTGLLGGIKKIFFSGVLSSVSWTEVDCIVPNGVVRLEGQSKIFLPNRASLGC